MKRIAGILLGLAMAAPAAAEEAAIEVRADMRVELMSILFRLAGNPEYAQGRVEGYAKDVEETFGGFRDHDAVRYARQLRRTRGVSYDAVMSMAVHLKDGYGLEPRLPLDPRPENLDERWRPDEAKAFLEKARDFVREAGFREFVDRHETLFASAAGRLRDTIARHAHPEWFEQFFGERPGAVFVQTFGLLNGGSCYGARIRTDKVEELYSILGVWMTDRDGAPTFDGSIVDTVIHEFCHSYANPLVDAHLDELRAAGETIFPRVAPSMRRQAYGSWPTMFRETLVRACVVRYVRTYGGDAAAAKQIAGEKQRSFFWIAEVEDLLASYESDRETYPDLDAFFGRIVAFFDDYAPRFAKEMEERGRAVPKIVSMTPENGDTSVDPSLAKITVVFDRPMKDGTWSMVGGGPHFPEIAGKPAYDETRKVWTVAVKLKPEWDYRFWLNSDRYKAFTSAEGVALEPVEVRFRTRGR